MKLQNLRPSQRLRYLARRLRGNLRTTFNQSSSTNCVVGIGARMKDDGTIGNRGIRAFSGDVVVQFAEKFGVTRAQAHALYLAEYGKLRIGVPTITDHWSTLLSAQFVAGVLDILADKYEHRGK